MPVTPFTTHDQTQTELQYIETQTKPKHTDRTRRPRQRTESRKQESRRSRYRKYWRANREDCDSQRKRENDKEESMITTTKS